MLNLSYLQICLDITKKSFWLLFKMWVANRYIDPIISSNIVCLLNGKNVCAAVDLREWYQKANKRVRKWVGTSKCTFGIQTKLSIQ